MDYLIIENIKNMLKPIPIMDQKPGLTFVELTKWMNSLRGFKIQDEAPYINKMFSLYAPNPYIPTISQREVT